jgi:hypothetical protein
VLPAFLVSGGVRADEPRDKLLSLVPPDMEVCLVVNGLREQARQVGTAAWFRALWDSPLRESLAGTPEMKKLLSVQEELRKHFQADFARLRDELFGDAVVFAYRSGPPANAEKERGLFLLWARDPALMEKLLEVLNREQKRTGELTSLETRSYKQVRYFQRITKEKEQYYYIDGALLAFASDEDLIRKAIDRHLAPRPTPPALAEAFAARPAKNALAALWINPRMLDAELEAKAKSAESSEAAVHKHLLVYWKALDGIVVSLAVRPDVELSLSMRAHAEKLPASWRRIVDEAARPSKLWERFPEKPLLAFVGRIDAKAVTEAATDFLTPEARKGFTDAVGRVLSAPLGMDVFDEVLPYLGPEWGVHVGAAAAGEGIPRVLLALQVQSGPKNQPVDQALIKGLHVGAMLATLSYNSSHADQIRMKSVRQGDVEVNYLTNEKSFPKGMQPAFALKGGYLVLGSNPEVISNFRAAHGVSRGASAERPVLRMTLTEWEKILKAQRAPWVLAMTADGKLDAEAAGRVADGILLVLRQFEQLEVNQWIQKGQVTWTMRLLPERK